MIKFQFKIIVEKGGLKKRIEPLKGLLSRTASSLALVLSVLTLSTIIGLGIHLVFAAPYTNPTAEPPLGNVDAPINVSDVSQTKAGDLTVGDTIDAEKIYAKYLYVEGYTPEHNGFYGIEQAAVFKSWVRIVDADFDVYSNHWGTNWYSYSLKEYNSDHTLNCPDGSYVRGFTTHDNGKIHYFYCSEL